MPVGLLHCYQKPSFKTVKRIAFQLQQRMAIQFNRSQRAVLPDCNSKLRSHVRCSRNAVRLGVMVVLSNRGQDVRVCGSGGVPWRRAGQPVASQCATRARLSTWREARAGRGGRGGRGGPRRRRRAPTRPPNTDCLVCASSETTTFSYHY